MQSNIPYYANPTDTHCAQACLRMGYEYFNPDKQWTWEELDDLTGHVEGLTTWNMKGYVETAKLGYDIVVFDPLDYRQFITNPRAYISTKFNPAYAEETFRLSDMDRAVNDAKELLAANDINIHTRSYVLEEYKQLIDENYLIATWVDGAIINGMANKCWPHFVLVYGYDKEGIFAHDPGGTITAAPMQCRHIKWDMFERANKINDKGERGEVLAFRKRKDEK